MGPSMAAGSHGCRPNWADFPVAAKMRPSSGMMLGVFSCENICGSSHVDMFIASQAIVRISPISPIRL